MLVNYGRLFIDVDFLILENEINFNIYISKNECVILSFDNNVRCYCMKE